MRKGKKTLVTIILVLIAGLCVFVIARQNGKKMSVSKTDTRTYESDAGTAGERQIKLYVENENQVFQIQGKYICSITSEEYVDVRTEAQHIRDRIETKKITNASIDMEFQDDNMVVCFEFTGLNKGDDSAIAIVEKYLKLQVKDGYFDLKHCESTLKKLGYVRKQ